jgi:flagellar biosynthesis protein FlhG
VIVELADQATGLRRLLAGASVRTICVAGGVAGCGRTTLAANLAAALSRQGSRVLLLDGCSGAPRAAHLLGGQPGVDLLDALKGPGRGISALTRCAANLDVLQADRTLRSLRRAPGESAAWLSDVLDSLRDAADLLVIDAPVQALAPAVAASDLILVTTPDAPGLMHSYSIIKRLAAHGGRQRGFVLVNRAASAAQARRIFGNLAKTAEDFLGAGLQYLGWLPDDDCIGRAAAAGRAVLDAFPFSPAAQALRECARNVHAWPASGESTLAPFTQRLVNASRIAAQYVRDPTRHAYLRR